jgi:pilus assembly protein Flp/PilA
MRSPGDFFRKAPRPEPNNAGQQGGRDSGSNWGDAAMPETSTPLFKNTRRSACSFLADKDGASAAEYTLILALVGAAIGAAAFVLGGTIGTALGNFGTCIATNGANCP